MSKKFEKIDSNIFNFEQMVLPAPSVTDGLGFPIVNPDGTITHCRVKDVFFYNDIEHAKALDPIALRQVLATDMTEQGYAHEDLEDEDILNDVIESCPSRYLYSPNDIKEYINTLKDGIKSRVEYAKKIKTQNKKSD